MKPPVDGLREVIARRLGLRFDAAKTPLLEALLAQRVEHTGTTPEGYLAALQTEPASGGELSRLAAELTVPETYFFRNPDQFRALAEIVLPERLLARAAARRLSILSAGCASGEEAYSLAILTRGLVDRAWDVGIVGVDANPAVLAKARRGRYSRWSLRGTPPEVHQRWFRKEGAELVLDATIRDAVRFEQQNLLDASRPWPDAGFDVIFCRNVLMYFTPEAASTVVARIARALAPGGYLFLGHAETLRGVSSELELCHTHGTFYYQRPDLPSVDRIALPLLGAEPATMPHDFVAVPATWSPDAWFEAIQRSTARIEALEAPRSVPSSEAPAPSARELELALERLGEERYAEVLTVLDALPPEKSSTRDALLLRAVVLSHQARIAEAEEACRALLARDELDPGAHYVLALCRERLGDEVGAAHHDRAAVHADPAFAMPRLHLGLLARRRGDVRGARQELGRALVLLEREDPKRVLLFGGGFRRSALIALCSSELASSGGRA